MGTGRIRTHCRRSQGRIEPWRRMVILQDGGCLIIVSRFPNESVFLQRTILLVMIGSGVCVTILGVCFLGIHCSGSLKAPPLVHFI